MNGMADEATSPASTAAGASRAAPNSSSAPVAATESRDPASSTFHSACRKAAPRARARAPPLMGQAPRAGSPPLPRAPTHSPRARPGRLSGVQRLLHPFGLRSLDVRLLFVLLLFLVVHRLGVHRPDVVLDALHEVVDRSHRGEHR